MYYARFQELIVSKKGMKMMSKLAKAQMNQDEESAKHDGPDHLKNKSGATVN